VGWGGVAAEGVVGARQQQQSCCGCVECVISCVRVLMLVL
jgi:hypothetical protein